MRFLDAAHDAAELIGLVERGIDKRQPAPLLRGGGGIDPRGKAVEAAVIVGRLLKRRREAAEELLDVAPRRATVDEIGRLSVGDQGCVAGGAGDSHRRRAVVISRIADEADRETVGIARGGGAGNQPQRVEMIGGQKALFGAWLVEGQKPVVGHQPRSLAGVVEPV